MESKIFKYPIKVGEETAVRVPENADLLSVKSQSNEVVAYFLITEESMSSGLYEERVFFTVPTGQQFDLKRGMLFYETLMMYGDNFVLHVFTR